MGINEQLQELYDEYYEDFISSLLKLEETKKESGHPEKCSNPLLMYCWEKEYENAKVKILFIGQETNSWYKEFPKGNNNVQKNIEFCKKFNFGINENNPSKNYNSPFWNFIRIINEHFNGKETKHSFLWTNINKIGKEEGVGAPSEEFLKIEKEKFNVLEEEIKIVNPDVVIFMTGKEKEYYLNGKLRVSGNPELFDQNLYIQKIECNGFEDILFLRTYHPGFMTRSGDLNLYINKIIEIIKQHMVSPSPDATV